MRKLTICLWGVLFVVALQGSVADSRESWTKDDLAERLEALETQMETLNKTLLNKTAELQESLDRTNLKIIHSKFQLIGSGYFYIEYNIKQNWTAAAVTCRNMGGYLALIRNEQEFNGIVAKLKKDQFYLVGLNDKANGEGKFPPEVAEKAPTFLKWYPKKTDNEINKQLCVYIYDGYMYDYACESVTYFICQAN